MGLPRVWTSLMFVSVHACIMRPVHVNFTSIAYDVDLTWIWKNKLGGGGGGIGAECRKNIHSDVQPVCCPSDPMSSIFCCVLLVVVWISMGWNLMICVHFVFPQLAHDWNCKYSGFGEKGLFFLSCSFAVWKRGGVAWGINVILLFTVAQLWIAPRPCGTHARGKGGREFPRNDEYD